MSLDVYLRLHGTQQPRAGSGIFIREDGQTKEITSSEYDRRFPGGEPIVLEQTTETDEVFHANITHNLASMALMAELYDCLWRPDEMGIASAKDLVPSLRAGLQQLLEDPESFQEYNPPNGWGNYDILLGFCARYLAACVKYPEAMVEVSR